MTAAEAVALGRGSLGVPVRYLADGCADAVVEDLLDAWAFPFELVRPIRRIASFKGQRNFTGLWWSSTTGDHVGFESWVERDHLMALDRDPRVVGLSSQPFEMTLTVAGRAVRHVPDYFVRYASGAGLVLDVRPDALVKPDDAATFLATAAACELVGWSYERRGDPEPVLTANLRWLAGYRHARLAGPDDRWESLMGFLDRVGPTRIGSLAAGVGLASVVVLPSIYHRLWRGDLDADLGLRPMSLNTLVSLAREPS